MTESDMLFWIMLTSLITSIINCIEIISLIKSSRKTNQILEDPAPVVKGFMNSLKHDPEFAKEFSSFLLWCGQSGMAGIKDAMTDAGMKPPKIKNFSDAMGFLFQLPAIQDAIQKKISKGLANTAEDAVQTAVEKF